MASKAMNDKRFCLTGAPVDIFPEVTFGTTGTPTLVTEGQSSYGVKAFKQALAASSIYVLSLDDTYARLRGAVPTFHGQVPTAREFCVLAKEVGGSVATISCATVAVGNTVSIRVPGSPQITYTAVAYDATTAKTNNKFCIGNSTGADSESGNNLAACIRNDSTDADQAGKGDTNGNGGSTDTPATLTAWNVGGVVVLRCTVPGMTVCSNNATKLAVTCDAVATVNVPTRAWPGLVLQFGSAGSAITALTDNSGGATADGTIAVVTAPTAIANTLTDSTGLSGTHDDTIAVLSNSAGRKCGNLYAQNLAAATTTGKATQLDVSAGAAAMASLVQPDYPRNAVITFTDANASISAFQVDVVGTAWDGSALTEQFVFAGGLVQSGIKAFKSVTSVTLTSVTGQGAGDTLDLGYGNAFGLPVPPSATTAAAINAKVLCDGSAETVTISAANNTWTPTTAANATHDYQLDFSYVDPTQANLTQNQCDIAEKVMELCASESTARTAIIALTDAIKELSTKVNEIRTAISAAPASGDAVKIEVTLENASRTV